MKRLSNTFQRVMLLTTMLFAPATAALAQQAEDPNQGEFGFEEEIEVLGVHIPTPMRETSEVAAFLSADDLARQGDDNAAVALTRLTGLSVVSGRFVYVRGLGDRYSSALLNGSPLPSPEPLRRQVPLDLFPSNILDGASVQKTFSPNYPGEFGGGIIDMRTLRMPNESFLTLKLGTGGNTEAWGGRGLTYRGETSDWSGLSDASRDLPAPLQAAIDTGRLVNSSNFSGAQLEAIGESLVNSPFTVVQKEDFKPDVEGEVTAGASVDLGSFNLGLVGVVGYDSSIRTRNAHRQYVVGDVISQDFNVQSTSWDVVFNTFGSASLGWGDQSVTVTGLLVRSTTKDAQIGEGVDGSRPTDSVLEESTAWYERQLASLQFAGEHRFGALDLDWRTAFAQSTRDAPYERGITREFFANQNAYGYLQRGLDNSTRFSDLTDEVASSGVDAAYTIPLSDTRDAIVSAGIAHSNSVRQYAQRQFSYLEAFPELISDSTRVARPDYLFSPDNIGPNGYQILESTGRDDSYKARLTVLAAYAAADVEIIPLVRAAIGVRYEDATEVVRTFNTFGQAPNAAAIETSNAYWLPAATLTWNFAEDLQLRMGYSQTIARPQFRELAISPYIDPDTDERYAGNPYLQDSEFKNYDARLEYYFGQNQFVTGGTFYKQIENPIEEVVVDQGGGRLHRFINAPEATLYGVELEYRTNFELPFDLPYMHGLEWLFSVNYTYTHSEVTGTDELVVNPIPLPSRVLVPASQFQIDGTPLQGTPENIANLQFGYQTDASQLTLLVGWVDTRIQSRGLGSLPSVLEDPGVNLDIVYKRDFEVAGSDMTFSVSGRNLLGEAHEEYQTSALGRSESNTYDRGQSFSISLTAKY